MQNLYSAQPRAFRVAMFVLSCALFALAFVWLGLDSYRTLGINPADGYGGKLAPWGDRALLGGALALLAGVVLASCALFLSVYVRQIYVQPITSLEGKGSVAIELNFNFYPPFRPMTLRSGDLADVAEHDGRYGTGTRAAPYLLLKTHKRKRPLLVDAQGDFVDEARLHQVLRQLS